MNFIDDLDCSHGALAVFNKNLFISGSKCLSLSIKTQLLELAFVLFRTLDHLDFRLFMFGSYS